MSYARYQQRSCPSWLRSLWRSGDILCAVLLLSTKGFAQAPIDSAAPIRVFINCNSAECFPDFLKTELSFFRIVRDMAQADVQVFVVQQSTAAAGRRYTLRFIGQGPFAGQTDSAVVITGQMDTESQMRNSLLTAIGTGLFPYAMKTPWRNALRAAYPAGASQEGATRRDPWRAWVFTLGLSGYIDGESNRRETSAENYLAVTKITPTHKTVVDGWYNTTRTRLFYDTVDIKVTVSTGGIRPYYAHALSNRWSVGMLGSAWYDEYRNIRLHYRLAPAVEYNFFPYAENTRRQLRVGYQAGIRRFQYYDTTVYDKLVEWRSYQQLAVVASFAQPWGSVNGLLQYNAYLDKLGQNRFSARLRASVRVLRGVNFTVDGSGSIVNDQISLSREAATEAQLLLRGAQLPTDVLYNVGVGLNFTFGSTNNSIVNPRFESIDE